MIQINLFAGVLSLMEQVWILENFRKYILLEHVQNADLYLSIAIIFLTILTLIQQYAFTRPPPVRLKVIIPSRPALQVLFKPDETNTFNSSTQGSTATVSSTLRSSSREVRNEVTSSANGDDEDDIEIKFHQNLPDSFAPLLSSSEMEVLLNNLTIDLIHGAKGEASALLKEGRHKIPLFDKKDNTRPQLTLVVTKHEDEGEILKKNGNGKSGCCQIVGQFEVGSDLMTSKQDLDASLPTTSRSRPMVKGAQVKLDPPLVLKNVAPTLVHLPTLFEDNVIPTLRRMQGVRALLSLLVSLSSFIERMLWYIESKCEINLGKIVLKPIYKGSSQKDNAPHWRLCASFSGHVLFFNFIPIPFFNVTLPTFIIPAPHALLPSLCSTQPLASAKLRHENFDRNKIALAVLDTIHQFDVGFKCLATPPAVELDMKVAGGASIAIETMLGRDLTAASAAAAVRKPQNIKESHSNTSLSTINTAENQTNQQTVFNANYTTPFLFQVSCNGKLEADQVKVNVQNLSAFQFNSDSKISTSGNIIIRHADESTSKDSIRPMSRNRLRTLSRDDLNPSFSKDDSSSPPSILSILLFPDSSLSYYPKKKREIYPLLGYDYAFDFNGKVDAISLSVGATHPMLLGGTIITTVLESIYAYGSLTAREGAVLYPFEANRKRNILRHLPAVDFSCGIGNVFIPETSLSYSDDGITKYMPELQGGRINIRIVGGFQDEGKNIVDDEEPEIIQVMEGVKFIIDFGASTFSLTSSTVVDEFPELDILEGTKLLSFFSGTFSGRISSHLRPQENFAELRNKTANKNIGPNLFNPLEAFEIDFSSSALSLKLKEYWLTLGHRRVIFPTETTFAVNVVESVVDMSFDGRSTCELSWDFQGSSPMLQVSKTLTESPADVSHEDRRQMPLLISALRQGRLNFVVSPVGGISFREAKTSRDYREGLYDWKFFNAFVSPDENSSRRLLDVLYDRPTIKKFLHVVQMINEELGEIAEYVVKQVWRAKDIFDEEDVEGPGHLIPGHKMARLLSLFLCGNDSKVNDILPVIRRVTAGDGLDVVKTKEILRENINAYDEWASEIDRAVRWAAVLFAPMAATQPFVENSVPPLSELQQFKSLFHGIPNAKEIYDTLNDKRSLPLDPSFITTVSTVAPYMSFKQVEYVLQARPSRDWQTKTDLRRLRYVYSIKKKVQEISESYGGLSFLPQSFLVSVFLGEATRASLRARGGARKLKKSQGVGGTGGSVASYKAASARQKKMMTRVSTLSTLRRRRLAAPGNVSTNIFAEISDFVNLTPAEKVASQTKLDYDVPLRVIHTSPAQQIDGLHKESGLMTPEPYDLGDSLLGPHDVAILLHSGLTSPMKGSTVVQLNQRMLLDLIASQPRSFALGVLCELGNPGGQGSTRGLTSALMALLELEQKSFNPEHRLDMHLLLETFSGIKMPRREHYLAGGRWARQSYYGALSLAAKSILEDADQYLALKGHIQRVRYHVEYDPVPTSKEYELSKSLEDIGLTFDESSIEDKSTAKFFQLIKTAKERISVADEIGKNALAQMRKDLHTSKESEACLKAIALYEEAFQACSEILEIDKMAITEQWLKSFYRRNYDALMIKSIYDNAINDVDRVRHWLEALRSADQRQKLIKNNTDNARVTGNKNGKEEIETNDFSFVDVCKHYEQDVIDQIIDAVFFDSAEIESMKSDPLVRLLIPNRAGKYNFTIISVMGIVTEGKRGQELASAMQRLKEERGVETIRADTGTFLSFEFNANKIEDAVEAAAEIGRPFGFLGYSQGCANSLTAESQLLSGSPARRKLLLSPKCGLVCRQLLFSAANGSMHGQASDAKVFKLIVLGEESLKYQQGYFSRAFISSTLNILNDLMDCAPFQKFIGGAQSMLPEGTRAFWREAQHIPHVPTSVMRGVIEEHTTPESLEMVTNLLTKQSSSKLHDTQVHVHDAVGYPVYTKNRNGKILQNCDMGGSIQRTHHWSPLDKEVEFVRTSRDVEYGTYDCAKDRHIFPWVDVNARFGIIKYRED